MTFDTRMGMPNRREYTRQSPIGLVDTCGGHMYVWVWHDGDKGGMSSEAAGGSATQCDLRNKVKSADSDGKD